MKNRPLPTPRQRAIFLRLLFLGALSLVPHFVHAAEPSVDFAETIGPILAQHCVRCHTDGNENGDISLNTAEDLLQNDYLVAGDPDGSYLMELITAEAGEQPQMPSEGEPLTGQQVALIRQWINEGARWPAEMVVRQKSTADTSWWSLQPLSTVAPPDDERIPSDWKRNDIDRFIYVELAEHGLTPNPPADRRSLIRRATHDLIGLPPTQKEIEDFVNDSAPNAFEKVVDRLLASPHYGERWGRHWLDVVRFGESNGYERNFIINDLWPFRDYVIQSLNEDRPFDQFIREHVAGDVIDEDTLSGQIASAFLVAGPFDDVGNQDPAQAAQIRANTIDEMIRTTSEAFLGLTVGCARCHDHKFDPIGQQDYYALYATFAGVRHGSTVVATAEEKAAHAARRQPLNEQREALSQKRHAILQAIAARADENAEQLERQWTRDKVNRLGTEECIAPVTAKFVRLISEGQDNNPEDTHYFTIDEFEIWSADEPARNVALSSNGSVAHGESRQIEDFPEAYGPQLAIDGRLGEQYISTGGQLTIELAEPISVDRFVFSSARGETTPEHPQFVFLAEYRIEVSLDGTTWKEVANSHDRRPVSESHRIKRLREFVRTDGEQAELTDLAAQLAKVDHQLASIAPLPTVWIGSRDAESARGPFHVFLGGNPQRPGDPVVPASLTALNKVVPSYALSADASEGARRQALADWITDSQNPLTARVLANRVWHYHFGTGIVDTPSDFGYMGSKPTHPALLDWLAKEIQQHHWQLKSIHKSIMLSRTYQQSSQYREEAASIDADARFLWRFPPRRLSAEEIRDTMLMVAGKLDRTMGGPGFRLYRFLQDNVATYVPLDQHGPDTYRRTVYHQNARASVVDLMTEYDQPDCAFSTPKRAETTTPLQALTMLNHRFTLDMSNSLAERIEREAGSDVSSQVRQAFLLCFGRLPADQEESSCCDLVEQYSLTALCRVLFNTSEMIYVP